MTESESTTFHMDTYIKYFGIPSSSFESDINRRLDGRINTIFSQSVVVIIVDLVETAHRQ
jgi:subtilase family serine protease